MDVRFLEKAEQSYLLARPEGYSTLVRPLVAETPARAYTYSPSIATISAGIESRLYDRGGPASWQRASLAWPGGGGPLGLPYYTRPVPAHVRWGSAGQKRVFLIFGSSYSTWKRGTWTNKTVELLRKEYHEPHLVVFAGFLTPEFLALRARHPALTTRESAQDLYLRLQEAVADWKKSGRIPADARIGLIGFSGGANLVISLLAQDARHGGPPLFDQGGMAFSPVLDLPTSYGVLDGAKALLDAKHFPPGRALTKPIFPDFVVAYLQGFRTSTPKAFLQLTAAEAPDSLSARRRDVIGRFYREFQAVDLVTTSEAIYPEALSFREAARAARAEGRLSYDEYYHQIVFRGLHPKDNLEAAAYSLRDELAVIGRSPLYLVSPQDDPVLSKIDFELSGLTAEGPARNKTVLAFAQNQPNVRVFNPKQGAHMGYFLDSSYLKEAFRGFFFPAH